MDKKSVNVKSFDEIFEERGPECQVVDMVIGEVYLCDQTDCFGWNKLIKYKGKGSGFKEHLDILTSGILFSDGDNGIDNPGIGMKSINVKSFFTATKNQIELLNAYKNGGK